MLFLYDVTLHFFQTMAPKPIATIEGHKDRAWNVSWNPKGTILASCSSDRSIRIHSQENDKWVCRTTLPEAHSRTVRSLSWSPCGRYFASSSFDSTVNIWDGKDGEFEVIATLEGHENEVKSVSWSSSGSYLVTCSRDKTVWVWAFDQDEDFECISMLPEHTQDVKRVLFGPNSDCIVSASYDNTLKMFREDDDEWVVSSTLTGHDSTVWCMDFNKDGDRLVSGSSDKSMRIWQRYLPNNKYGVITDGIDPKWKCVRIISGHHNAPVYDVSWCKLSNLIATACGDDTIRIFKETHDSDMHSPSFDLILCIDDAHSEDVNSVSWNPGKSGLLASAGDDGVVKIWDLSYL